MDINYTIIIIIFNLFETELHNHFGYSFNFLYKKKNNIHCS